MTLLEELKQLYDAAPKETRQDVRSVLADLTNQAEDPWQEVRRGFGEVDLSTLAKNEFVTASGNRDGGYIVWKLKHESKAQES